MRVNVYSEELTERVQIVSKTIEGQTFTGVRFYLALPVSLATPSTRLGGTTGIAHIQGPFIHHDGDDDSSAITFWGKHDLRVLLRTALRVLDEHYAAKDGSR